MTQIFTCKVCSRKFNTQAALGGHTSSVHPKNRRESERDPVTGLVKVEPGLVQVEPPEPQTTPPESQDDESLAAEIRDYLKRGFGLEQLTKQFHFKDRTVRQEMAKMISPEGESVTEGVISRDGMPRMPLVLKVGTGHEMISPEGILQSYLLSDGDAGAWMFKGMMLLRAAQLMNLTDVEIMKGQADAQAKALKPILEVMEQARKDMDAAAQRARESNAEIAEAAAMGAAGGVLGRIDAKFAEFKQQKTDIATVPDPMKGLMARTMEIMMNRISGMMGGGQGGQGGQVPLPPGCVDKRG